MNRRLSSILILAVLFILAVVWSTPARAGHAWAVWHDEDQGRGQPAFEMCMPAESQAGHAGHVGDYEVGPCENPDATATPVPTAIPTAEPTADPTEEPTEEPTVEPTPTEVSSTPTETVGATPPPCDDDPCAYLFHLVGPNGEEADFASFNRRPDGGWYLPNVGAQLQCLGWVAVSAPYGRELSRDEASQLTSCFGGFCVVES